MALDPRIVLLVGAETAIVDESSYARTLTAVGNAARTTAQFKYGTASLTFDGSGDWVQAADSADFTLGAGDFTIEGWFRFVTKTDNQALLGHWSGATITSSSWFLFITSGQLLFRDVVSGSGGVSHDLAYTWTPTLGQWYHLAVDRSGSTLRLYIDGAVVATNAAFVDTLNDSTEPISLGAIGVTNTFSTFDFNGQMDEVRITKGLAQYAGAFTPPSGPFSRGSTEGRVTQDAIETLTQPTNVSARVSQDAVETLSQPVNPAARISQAVIEVLGGTIGTSTAAQVTQQLVELLTRTLPTPAQVTQAVVELLVQSPSLATRTTQLAVEVFESQSARTRTTQLAIELYVPITVPTRVTQAAVELYRADAARTRVTQEVVELWLTLPPCTTGDFPIDPDTRAVQQRRLRPEATPLLPTNTTPATALDLGVLPADVTTDTTTLGTALLYYRYTAIPGEYVVGGSATSSDVSARRPVVNVYLDVVFTEYLTGLTSQFQLSVTPGQTYYFEIDPLDPTPAVRFTLTRAPNLATPAGSIAINDDADGFPLAVLSAADGTVQQFRTPFPAGENAAALPNGISLWRDGFATLDTFCLYDATLTRLATIVWPVLHDAGIQDGLICTNRSTTFYLGQIGGGFPAQHARVTTLSSTGAFGPTVWTLPGVGLITFGVSPDEATLYYIGNSTDLTHISRWDLVHNAALAPLVPLPTTTRAAPQGLAVLVDGTLLLGANRTAAPHTSSVYRYAADGTLLHTYPLGTDVFNKLVAALDDPASFWVWSYAPTGAEGFSHFQRIRISDGVVLIDFTVPQYEDGVYVEPGDPTQPFGHSFSCPFVVLPMALAALPGPDEPPPVETDACQAVLPIDSDD